MEDLNQRRIQLYYDACEAQKFALDACSLAEKARALAREIQKKNARYFRRKVGMMSAEIAASTTKSGFSSNSAPIHEELPHSRNVSKSVEAGIFVEKAARFSQR